MRTTVRPRRPPITRRRHPAVPLRPETGEVVEILEQRMTHHESSPLLSGGDVDADWQGALASGDEAVGGTAPTPDQDIVDEIGRALGVEQASDAELYTSGEILDARHRHYWHLERDAAGREEA